MYYYNSIEKIKDFVSCNTHPWFKHSNIAINGEKIMKLTAQGIWGLKLDLGCVSMNM